MNEGRSPDETGIHGSENHNLETGFRSSVKQIKGTRSCILQESKRGSITCKKEIGPNAPCNRLGTGSLRDFFFSIPSSFVVLLTSQV